MDNFILFSSIFGDTAIWYLNWTHCSFANFSYIPELRFIKAENNTETTKKKAAKNTISAQTKKEKTDKKLEENNSSKIGSGRQLSDLFKKTSQNLWKNKARRG